MDETMDSTIDPTIGSQTGIFSKFSLESDLSTQHNTGEDAQGAAHAALMAHQQGDYHFEAINELRSNGQIIPQENEDAANASANLSSIINFNQLDQDSADPPTPTSLQHQIQGSSGKHQSQLTFLQNALVSTQGASSSSASLTPGSPDAEPKQKLIKDPNSKVSIVVVNPASKEGTGRLGRPRRSFDKNNQNNTTKTLMENSANNKEECLVSRFRVDSKPVLGPGSRGGKVKSEPKKKAVLPTDSTTPEGSKFVSFAVHKTEGAEVTPQDDDDDEKQQQETTPEATSEEDEDVAIVDDDSKESPVPASKGTPGSQLPQLLPRPALPSKKKSSAATSESNSPQLTNSFILEDYESLKAKGRSVQKDKQDVFSKLGLVPLMPKKQAAATAEKPAATEKKVVTRQRRPKPPITKAREMKRKDIPGPITPAFWDLYDPQILKLDELQETGEDNMIALGYTVKPAPYAKDIMFILSFIAKFKKFFSDLPNLGPQDFEEGLKLGSPEKYNLENSKQADAVFSYKDEDVSECMNCLLLDLLKLVLNRKKPIAKAAATKALYDLKALVLSFGLPSEWRNDTGVYAPPLINDELKNPDDEEPVDPENNEVFDTIQYHYDTTKPLMDTPLDNETFETEGLKSLKPSDRLIFLRTLVHWCCANSDAVRKEINDQISRQDASGEKETYYISRFIKEGAEGVDAANNSLKLHPRKKIKKTDDSDNTVIGAYTDASVNPVDHHMSFRLLDFYAGDGGVTGRFYLCRSADNSAGGFSSVAEFQEFCALDKTPRELSTMAQPSRFKLYAEDVTTLLGSTLEVETALLPEKKDTVDAWYEVASNATELSAFVQFLSNKLSTFKSKPLQHLHDYLSALVPILLKFDVTYSEYTSLTMFHETRKRVQVTDLKAQDRKLRKLIKNEKPEDEFLRNDSDVEMEDDDGEEFDIGHEPDDADDDDYRD